MWAFFPVIGRRVLALVSLHGSAEKGCPDLESGCGVMLSVDGLLELIDEKVLPLPARRFPLKNAVG